MTTAPLISQLSARPSWLYPVHCETGRHRSAGALPLAGPAAPAALVGIQLTLVRLAAALISIFQWLGHGRLEGGRRSPCRRDDPVRAHHHAEPGPPAQASPVPSRRFCAQPSILRPPQPPILRPNPRFRARLRRRFCASLSPRCCSRPSRRICVHPSRSICARPSPESGPARAAESAPSPPSPAGPGPI